MTVIPNSGYFMCSTTDSTTPKTDMSHMTHTLLLSLAARRPASSPSGAYKNSAATLFRRHKHSVWIAVRIRACLMAHAPTHTNGASCVEPNDSTLCTYLQWFTRVSSAFQCLASFLRTVNFSQSASPSTFLLNPPCSANAQVKSSTSALIACSLSFLKITSDFPAPCSRSDTRIRNRFHLILFLNTCYRFRLSV